jgi:anti-sigma B factor antagonist
MTETPPIVLTNEALRDRTVVQIRGDVDAHTAPELRAHLLDLLRGGDRHLVVNLDGVEFMDSSGLGVLVAVRRRLQSNDGLLRVVCSREPILKVLRITALDRAFPIHNSVDEAVAAGF